MRRILLNHARAKKAGKRGAGTVRLNIEDAEVMSQVMSPETSCELVALDESLKRLAKFDRLKSRIVEMRYFGGLSLEETAEVLSISPSTLSLHWRLARV